MSSGRRTNVVRPAQYTDSTAPNASMKAATESTGTSSAAARRARAKPTASSGVIVISNVTVDHRLQARGAHPLLVLAVLHDGTEGGVGRRHVELRSPQRRERLRPVDRLGHAGRLEQLQLAQTANGRRRLSGERVTH